MLLANLISLYVSSTASSSLFITILSDEHSVTVPEFFATTHTPESTAAFVSIPVPTTGASVIISGTACLCMFEPIRARLASSFSRKGIILVATENTILGDTSIKSIFFFANSEVSSR